MFKKMRKIFELLECSPCTLINGRRFTRFQALKMRKISINYFLCTFWNFCWNPPRSRIFIRTIWNNIFMLFRSGVVIGFPWNTCILTVNFRTIVALMQLLAVFVYVIDWLSFALTVLIFKITPATVVIYLIHSWTHDFAQRSIKHVVDRVEMSIIRVSYCEPKITDARLENRKFYRWWIICYTKSFDSCWLVLFA